MTPDTVIMSKGWYICVINIYTNKGGTSISQQAAVVFLSRLILVKIIKTLAEPLDTPKPQN